MFAAIVIPEFELQAVLRHEPALSTQPVALLESDLPIKTITRVNPAAKHSGVETGMTPAQATARCAAIVFKSRTRALERSAGEVLLQTACSFSPNLEATAPGVCTIDLKGLGLKTEAAQRPWAEKILHSLAALNLSATAGLAVTPGLARLAASCAGPVTIVLEAERFVARLPVSALAPPPQIAQVLERWGIRRAGELVALGRHELAERLGPEILPLFDLVSTETIRPLQPAAPSSEFVEEMEFEREIETVEPLLFVLHRFVEQLARRLDLLGLVVAEFQLHLQLAKGAPYERVLKIPSPTGRVEILFRMLQTHLETVRTDSPIVSLRLAAIPTRQEAHQFGLFESTLRDPNQFAETLARLSALCGSGRVGSPVLPDTHRPDTFQLRTPDFDVPPGSGSQEMARPAERLAGLSLRRLRPSQPLRVQFRDGRPAVLHRASFNAAVAASSGPYLTSGNWWDRETWAREEWDIETQQGELLRIHRTADECFLDGIYD